ncbi:MAG TPA: adenylate/guanylate cyclase domain-containing protein [Acidimicrobiia bacterium]|nr:adenylate/guanylate cyclase domain-containing protein [Acidimicrobiia bacterium]
MTQTLDAGRRAFEQRSWEQAYQELSAADQEAGLHPDDLERLADAAWWSARSEEAVDLLERAYLGYLQEGSNGRAALMAIRLAERAIRSLEGPVAQGWLARAVSLLEGEPESAVHAWAEFMRGAEALIARGDLSESIEHAERAMELGRAHGDTDVVTMARSFKGAALTKMGRVEEGLALIDESALAATAGELDAKTACDVYCFTIATCRDVSDLRRASEWTERADRYMQRNSIDGYPGACMVHRAELKRLHGRLTEAEEEARAACDELERFRLVDLLGLAHNEIGEVRLRVGDLAGAEEAFLKAYEYGADPQPGLARVHLAKGAVEEASRSLERSRNRLGGKLDLVAQVRLFPASVEVALAGGDLDAARSATESLEQLAADHQNPIWTANATTARGTLDVAEGNLEEATERLDSAWRQWQELDFPYESARARTELGLARRAMGDESGARLELNGALSVLRRLGAARDVGLVESALGSTEEKTRATVTKTFMFTDIVTSTDLIGLIGDSAWADLLEWHNRTLRARFAAHGGEVVNHTGDGFFVVFGDPTAAVECAVEIQRSLRGHRSDHGFAPSIRIGIHTDEATQGEGTFTGRGVHVAARVGAVGQGEEITVSAATLEGVADLRYPLSEPKTVNLKGVAEPVDVRTITWI